MAPLSVPAIESILVAEIATILSRDEDGITPATTLQSLGVDSLRLVSILIFVEERFGLKLIETGLRPESLQSISTLARCIHHNLV